MAELGRSLSLADVAPDQMVELVRIDLPEHEMVPLLELGILPGCHLCRVRHSPWGDPIVMVDGCKLALRRSTADRLCIRMIGGGCRADSSDG